MSADASSSDLLPARMLNEFVYCSRLFYLEFVKVEFQDSEDTIEGTARHRRVNVEAGELEPPGSMSKTDVVKIHARSVILSGQYSGIIARMDLIEGQTKDSIQ